MMRFFLVSSGDIPISLISHDYVKGTYNCRCKNESLMQAFNNVCNKISGRFVKRGNTTYLVSYGPRDFDWIDKIMKETCSSKWTYVEISNSNMSNVFDKYADEYISKSI